MCVSCMLSAQAQCSLLSLCLGLLAQALCALLSLCLKMPGPHLLKYVVPLWVLDDETTFLIYIRDWYRIHRNMSEAKWIMWLLTADWDEWWRPKTWHWVGSKHLRGSDEESVTDFWPHLSTYAMPDTIIVYT